MSYCHLLEIEERHRRLIGNKAYYLGILLKNKIPCLDGYVLYDKVNENDIRAVWGEMRGKIPLAVRSSMAEEDSYNVSNAGKFKTILGVKKYLEFKKAIYKVFASSGNEIKACLIQPMIDADVSGIMFTRNPNGENNILIESIFGLGELLVSGAVSPDRYKISNDGIILNKIIPYKTYALVLNKNYHVGSLIKRSFGDIRCVIHNNNKCICSLNFSINQKETLEYNNIVDLIKISKEIERILEQPQDIEFAIKNGQIFILQSRPITKVTYFNQDYNFCSYELVGTIASPGIVQGKVAILDKDKLIAPNSEKYILVANQTTPTIVYNMEKIIGIVTETGGILCHAAIVARELNIPCLTNVQRATEKLRVGDEIILNCNDGFILRRNKDE